MATKKTEQVDPDEPDEAVVEAAPNNSARPNDNPIDDYAHPNSTFAQRAKASGRNKRVEASESK